MYRSLIILSDPTQSNGTGLIPGPASLMPGFFASASAAATADSRIGARAQPSRTDSGISARARQPRNPCP